MGFGDELMTTGHCRVLQQTDPRKVRLDYGKRLWNEVFDFNPRIAHGTDRDVQVYQPRVGGLRPYCARKTDRQWIWRDDYRPPVGELYFQRDELDFASRFNVDVVIEPTLKINASPNKDWGAKRWQHLVELIVREGLQPVQLGKHGTLIYHPAVRLIETRNFRHACAVMARAKAAVLTEGGLHHGAAAVGTRAVVIYGGFISPRQTGYDLHVNLFTGGEPCGMRVACRHCEQAMAQITPEQVVRELMNIVRYSP